MHDEIDLIKIQKWRQLLLNLLNALFNCRMTYVFHRKFHLKLPKQAFFATQEVVEENL